MIETVHELEGDIVQAQRHKRVENSLNKLTACLLEVRDDLAEVVEAVGQELFELSQLQLLVVLGET